MPSGHGWRIWIRPDPDHGWMEPVIAGPGADVGWDGQEDAELSRRVSVTASRPAPRFECYVRVSIQTTRCSRASALVRLARRQRDHTGIGGNGRRSFSARTRRQQRRRTTPSCSGRAVARHSFDWPSRWRSLRYDYETSTRSWALLGARSRLRKCFVPLVEFYDGPQGLTAKAAGHRERHSRECHGIGARSSGTVKPEISMTAGPRTNDARAARRHANPY